jgi:cytochrome oxidase Cu insertion factor (SCO1/SenC/PrrC family)
MRRLVLPALAIAVAVGAAAVGLHMMTDRANGEQPVELKADAPPFEGIEEWINSKPLAWKDLKGQVVIVHFWTFG